MSAYFFLRICARYGFSLEIFPLMPKSRYLVNLAVTSLREFCDMIKGQRSFAIASISLYKPFLFNTFNARIFTTRLD